MTAAVPEHPRRSPLGRAEVKLGQAAIDREVIPHRLGGVGKDRCEGLARLRPTAFQLRTDGLLRERGKCSLRRRGRCSRRDRRGRGVVRDHVPLSGQHSEAEHVAEGVGCYGVVVDEVGEEPIEAKAACA